MPTRSGPKISVAAKNFSDDQRLDRCGVERAAAPGQRWRTPAPVATRLLPEPVGVAKITFDPGDQLEQRVGLRRIRRQPLAAPPTR